MVPCWVSEWWGVGGRMKGDAVTDTHFIQRSKKIRSWGGVILVAILGLSNTSPL